MARPKGSKNKRAALIVAKVAESGLTPLEYLLSVYQNDGNPESMRIDAAKAAAPYVHARLSNVEMAVTDETRKPEELTDAELANLAASGSKGVATPKGMPQKSTGVH